MGHKKQKIRIKLFSRLTMKIRLTIFLISVGGVLNATKLSCTDFKRVYNRQLEKFTRYQVAGKLQMKISIYPRTYKIAELALQGEFTEARVLQKTKGNELYFSIELSCPDAGQTEFLNLESAVMSFSERIEYYHFKFLNDIKVEIDNKPIAISGFQFERLFNISPKGKFYGVIPIKKRPKKLNINIADKIYDHDSSLFEFDLSPLRKLPKLKKIKNPGKN